jgi:nucleoside phosphorylase
VQTLLDTFDIQGIVHYGIAGSTNDSLNIGDVSVPNYVAFTGSWKWKVQV